MRDRIEAHLQSSVQQMIPQLSIDCVIFSFHDNQLKVLLLKFFKQDLLFLPSGFIRKDEDVDAAALRNLKERTGLDQIFLQQFHAFGKASRYYPEQMQAFISSLGIERQRAEWFFRRFVTIGYYALVDYEAVKPQADVFTEACIWANVEELPGLIMDHAEMIGKAVDTLKMDIQIHPVALQLLPNSFTLPELQRLYEIILDRPIDRRNFRKKLLAGKTLIQLDERRTGKGHRSPNLYKFDRSKYMEALEEKIKLGF